MESIRGFELIIKAEGRVSEGDIKLTYTLSNGEYSDPNTIEGNELAAITEEYLRRHGWTERHQPLLLTVTEQTKADPDALKPTDDITF